MEGHTQKLELRDVSVKDFLHTRPSCGPRSDV